MVAMRSSVLLVDDTRRLGQATIMEDISPGASMSNSTTAAAVEDGGHIEADVSGAAECSLMIAS